MGRPKKSERQRAIENLRLIYQGKAPEGEIWNLDLDVASQPAITPKLRDLTDGVQTAIDALRTSEESEAIAFIKQYDELGAIREWLSIEEISTCAGVKTRSLYGVISSALLEFEEDATKLLLAVNSRKILQKSIDMALTNRGFADREVIHKATGVLPTPRGAQIYINKPTTTTNTQNILQAPSEVYKDPGDRLRDVHSAWDQPRLPATVNTHSLEGVIDGMQTETAEILDV